MMPRLQAHKLTSKTFIRVAAPLLLILVSDALPAGTAALQYQDRQVDIDGAKHLVHIPKGYALETLTTALDGPRLLTFAANGDLFIGSKSGDIYRLEPPYIRPQVLVHLDDYPHSVALRKGELLIAQTHGLYRAPYQPGQKTINKKDVALLAALPGGLGHNSRTVAIGPDKRVYVSLGISRNCSAEYLDESYEFQYRRGGVLVLQEDGKTAGWKTFASGLRNPVGFDWHPQTREMYASNNGPDHLGFDQPPEYFSRLTAGSFHGMPWFQFDGKNIHRDNCVQKPPPRPIDDVTPPVATFPSRNAPMAVAFVTKGALDMSLYGDAVVALRGSWGTPPNGGPFGSSAGRRQPKLVIVRFSDGIAQRVDDLVTGFQLEDGTRWARPVGVAIGPDGALYFTSDSDTHGLFRLRKIP